MYFSDQIKILPSYKYNYRPRHFKKVNHLQKNSDFRTIIHFTQDCVYKLRDYYYENAKDAVYHHAISCKYNNFIYELRKKWREYAYKTPFYQELKKEAEIKTLTFRRWLPSLKRSNKYNDRDKFYKYTQFFIKLNRALINDPSFLYHYLAERGYKKIAFFGRTLISDELRKILKDFPVEISYVIENNCHIDIPAYPRETAEVPAVDILIVTDVTISNNTMQKIIKAYHFKVIKAFDLF